MTAVRGSLRTAADPARASGQQAYMKSAMPFLGVRVPEVRRLVRAEARNRAEQRSEVLSGAAAVLWDEATHREERYAALALLGLPPLRGEWSLVDLFEHVARSGAWWDFVDETAHRVADLHDAHPAATAAKVRAWACDESMWVRRLAVLSQLGRRDRTDLGLLTEVIEPNLADREFFVRKAIGWALREAARDDPAWVRSFVATHDLGPLSRREALKHLG